MNLQSKYSDLMLNLLVALAISLVVNFSYAVSYTHLTLPTNSLV